MSARSSRFSSPTVRKLLEAAEEVFAERGFSGARIDEVAARAGMAKSHVYYHFDGKQQILEDLIAWRTGELLAQKDVLLREVRVLDRGTIAAVIRRAVLELLLPRAAFIRVVLLESIGRGGDGPGGEEPLLLRVLRPLLDDAVSRFEALGYALDRDAFVSDLFHFGLLPVVLHVALGDRWAVAAGIDPARARELFLSRLVELQGLNVRRLAPRRAGVSSRRRGKKP
jgi:AcrR family transcriptional regulator